MNARRPYDLNKVSKVTVLNTKRTVVHFQLEIFNFIIFRLTLFLHKLTQFPFSITSMLYLSKFLIFVALNHHEIIA